MKLHFLSVLFLPVALGGEYVNSTICDHSAAYNRGYQDYFVSMKKLYNSIGEEQTCVPIHRQCGWPKQSSNLPQFVLVIGLEGLLIIFGRSYSTLQFMIAFGYVICFVCYLLLIRKKVNARHYRRDVGDGVPRRTPEELRSGILEQFDIRMRESPPMCK